MGCGWKGVAHSGGLDTRKASEAEPCRGSSPNAQQAANLQAQVTYPALLLLEPVPVPLPEPDPVEMDTSVTVGPEPPGVPLKGVSTGPVPLPETGPVTLPEPVPTQTGTTVIVGPELPDVPLKGTSTVIVVG